MLQKLAIEKPSDPWRVEELWFIMQAVGLHVFYRQCMTSDYSGQYWLLIGGFKPGAVRAQEQQLGEGGGMPDLYRDKHG